MPAAEVSVVIPVYNNAATIRECLSSVLQSSYPIKDLIVVNDGSTDGTEQIARSFNCTVIDLAANYGVGIARNAGAARATGDLLFFTDGDVVLANDTIDIGVRRLGEDPGLAAVVGLYAKECGASGFASVFKNLVYHYVHLSSTEASSVFIGNCGMIRRRVFEQVGGFDSSSEFATCLEDVELGFRLAAHGERVVLDKTMSVTHLRQFTLSGLLYSDLFRRAVPWSKLILKYRHVQFDNCTRMGDLVRLVLAFVVLAAALAVPVLGRPTWPFFPVALGAFILSDQSVTAFLARERGVSFALRAVPMRVLYYWTGALGIALALAAWFRMPAPAGQTHNGRGSPLAESFTLPGAPLRARPSENPAT
ncbi:MAG: glycosyltransferase [Isosphaeraceae bacterium]|nr:glycosyltransferase [Isosphaeraceae bacterium]